MSAETVTTATGIIQGVNKLAEDSKGTSLSPQTETTSQQNFVIDSSSDLGKLLEKSLSSESSILNPSVSAVSTSTTLDTFVINASNKGLKSVPEGLVLIYNELRKYNTGLSNVSSVLGESTSGSSTSQTESGSGVSSFLKDLTEEGLGSAIGNALLNKVSWSTIGTSLGTAGLVAGAAALTVAAVAMTDAISDEYQNRRENQIDPDEIIASITTATGGLLNVSAADIKSATAEDIEKYLKEHDAYSAENLATVQQAIIDKISADTQTLNTAIVDVSDIVGNYNALGNQGANQTAALNAAGDVIAGRTISEILSDVTLTQAEKLEAIKKKAGGSSDSIISALMTSLGYDAKFTDFESLDENTLSLVLEALRKTYNITIDTPSSEEASAEIAKLEDAVTTTSEALKEAEAEAATATEEANAAAKSGSPNAMSLSIKAATAIAAVQEAQKAYSAALKDLETAKSNLGIVDEQSPTTSDSTFTFSAADGTTFSVPGNFFQSGTKLFQSTSSQLVESGIGLTLEDIDDDLIPYVAQVLDVAPGVTDIQQIIRMAQKLKDATENNPTAVPTTIDGVNPMTSLRAATSGLTIEEQQAADKAALDKLLYGTTSGFEFTGNSAQATTTATTLGIAGLIALPSALSFANSAILGGVEAAGNGLILFDNKVITTGGVAAALSSAAASESDSVNQGTTTSEVVEGEAAKTTAAATGAVADNTSETVKTLKSIDNKLGTPNNTSTSSGYQYTLSSESFGVTYKR